MATGTKKNPILTLQMPRDTAVAAFGALSMVGRQSTDKKVAKAIYQFSDSLMKATEHLK